MPDLWDTNPDSVFGAPGGQPHLPPSSHNDPSKS
jgi:hypothetical protein